MAKLSIECKKMMVKEVADSLNDASALIVTSYKGLKAQDLNMLRRELRSVSGSYVVVKDSIAKKALAENSGKYASVAELIEGEVGIVIDTKQDPSPISKIVVKFAKENEALKIRGGIISGKLISTQDISILASLPSREVLLSKLANVLNAPIQGLAGALAAIIAKLLYALNAVKDKKGNDPAVTKESVAEEVKPQTAAAEPEKAVEQDKSGEPDKKE